MRTEKPRAPFVPTRRVAKAGGTVASPPTVRDVAKAAGVSAGTVSNVLNGHRSAASDKTRKIVLEAVEHLGFRPRTGARSLRTAQSRSVAMIIADEAELYLQDAFPAATVAGFTSVLDRHGYIAVLHGCRLADFDEAAAIRQFGVDGYCLLLSGTWSERAKVIERMRRWRQPLVLLQETEQVMIDDICVVRQADRYGGVQIARHLLEKGITDATFIASQLDWAAVSARLAGVREAKLPDGKKLIVEELRCPSEHFDDVRRTVVDHLQDRKPGAIIGANDQIAIAAMQALADQGLKIPRDVSVTGFNGIEFHRYCQPTLTTVISPAFDLGVKRRANGTPYRR